MKTNWQAVTIYLFWCRRALTWSGKQALSNPVRPAVLFFSPSARSLQTELLKYECDDVRSRVAAGNNYLNQMCWVLYFAPPEKCSGGSLCCDPRYTLRSLVSSLQGESSLSWHAVRGSACWVITLWREFFNTHPASWSMWRMLAVLHLASSGNGSVSKLRLTCWNGSDAD